MAGMKRNGLLFIVIYLIASAAFPLEAPRDAYGFLYWVHGWRGRSPEGERVLCVQTHRYVAEWDVEAVRLKRIGRIVAPKSYEAAASCRSLELEAFEEGALQLEVFLEDRAYRCIGADLSALTGLESPSRIIEAGRYVQRFDIQSLLFATEQGEALPGTGRLEVVAWPDRLYCLLELSFTKDAGAGKIRLELKAGETASTGETPWTQLPTGQTVTAGLSWAPCESDTDLSALCEVSAFCLAEKGQALPVVFDKQRGCFQVDLPERTFDLAQKPQYRDQYALRLVNTTDRPVQVPLLFALQGAFSGITGMTPLLLDKAGAPTGVPVQISKNWHSKADAPELYEGPWFHGFALASLGPGASWEGRLEMVYAHWGGVPAVSHAQLCLIGWGVNQLWDQVAIGSWGESICYDPDINLNRSMVDDIRPLMVNGMGSAPEKPVRWNWTNNVGGGDFLVWFDDAGRRQYPEAMRTAYRRYGPNLTEAIYAGTMGGGAIAIRVAALSPRCDDVARAFHHLRYDVLRPAPFSRLAWYQLGADHYNDHQFGVLARGDASGLHEEWAVKPGGLAYERSGVLCEGEGPWWFSLHDAVPNAPRGGAWANRGLIVRSWKARISGEDYVRPHASFFGSENGVPSMNVELSPPPNVQELVPGDFVEALVEVVVPPMCASEYYGPNAALRRHLEENANTWAPVYRLAQQNALEITMHRGAVEQAYPMRLRQDERGELLFSVRGGAGYVPCTLLGITRPQSGSLHRLHDDLLTVADACALYNECRQVDYNLEEVSYEVTFNLLLDTEGDAPQTVHFRFTESL